MLDATYYAALGLSSIREKVLSGERLSPEDGLTLFNCPDITAVGALALHVRCRLHGHKAFYVVNRQINYTNVCVNGCTFCAFRRDREDEPGAFAMSLDDVLARLRIPPQLMGIVPQNAGGFGSIREAAEIYVANELEPVQARMTQLNDWVGEEVMRFKPYDIAGGE